jgi:hypothetical protein
MTTDCVSEMDDFIRIAPNNDLQSDNGTAREGHRGSP